MVLMPNANVKTKNLILRMLLRRETTEEPAAVVEVMWKAAEDVLVDR